MLAIAGGYEDGDDLDHLRADPGSSWPAVGRPTAAPTSASSPPSRAGGTPHGCVAPRHRHLLSAAIARPAMALSPGTANDGSPPPLMRPHRGWTFVRRHQPRGWQPQWLYVTRYCARGQAENLIKLHKTQLASKRTSRRSPLANQVRLVLQTGAYWLMLMLRDAIPRPAACHGRVHHTAGAPDPDRRASRRNPSRVRVAFAVAHPEAALFASLARCRLPAGP
jgi:hypothetical protein